VCNLDTHHGVHPRIGVVDVVPFVPLQGSTMDDAIAARNDFAQWAARELQVPGFLYGPERTLPDIRKNAWKTLRPDVGPQEQAA
jgi:glutamate formiminotransferase